MLRLNSLRTTIASACILVSLLLSNTPRAEEIIMGSVAMDIPAAMVKRLTPLTHYLSKETGLNISFRASPNLGSAVEDLGMNHTQIAYFTPAAYLEAHEKYSALPLVSPLQKGKGSFTLMIVVPNDSPVKNVKDLAGKKFAFGDKKAILQPAVVEGAGIKISDFASIDYLNHYDNIAKAVLNGDFDAGIVKDSIAEKFVPQGLRVIHTSPELPSYVFAINKQMSAHTAGKIKKAMLALKDDTEEHKAILTELESGYNGFEATSDKDFDGIRKLLKKK